MKKLVFVVLALGLMFNCSNNDDSEEVALSEDQIVGRWNLTHQESFGITINDTPCHQQSYIIWNADFTSERKTYANNGQGGPCFITGEGEGSWELIPDSESASGENYRFMGNNGTSIDEKIVFVDNNTMYIEYNLIDFYYVRTQ
ncbi:lipocalin family protein [Winogradskyella sp.]|uniref:lipocalin family protein n=1 Tax=Winogradskyella sp. TaxID=1883156 RepID=UPI003BABF8CD